MRYTFKAGAAVTQGAVVKLTGDFTVEIATAATDKIVGVALQGADADELLPVEMTGILLRGYAAGVISAGDGLIVTTAGDVTPASAGEDYRLIALEAAAAAGDEIRMMVYDSRIDWSAAVGKDVITVPMSFETDEQTATKIYFPFAVTITKIRGIVTKAIAGTDDGTITGANATGDSATGVITATASDALNTEYSVSPTTNNTVAADGYYKLTSAKTTAGGKVLVTIEYTK